MLNSNFNCDIMRFKTFLQENENDINDVRSFLTDVLELEDFDYEIHDDLSVSLKCDLNIGGTRTQSLKRLPIKFRHIEGGIWITNCKMETLIGLPEKITGSFNVINTFIKDLKFMPKTLGEGEDGSICLSQNRNLVSLEGCPEEISGEFALSDCNAITSLAHGPKKVGRNYKVDTCDKITAIDGIAREIGNHLILSNNRNLESLKGVHKMISSVGGNIDVSGSRFKSHILGILLVKDFKNIKYVFGNGKAVEAFKIILQCRQDGVDELDCQEKLCDAGLEDYAYL